MLIKKAKKVLGRNKIKIDISDLSEKKGTRMKKSLLIKKLAA